MGPEHNIRDAAWDGRSERVVCSIEHKIVPPLPDVPGNGSGNYGFSNGAASMQEEVEEAGGRRRRIEVVEETPGLPSPGVVQEKVINVFIVATGEASRRVRKPMSEPSCVGENSTSFSKPEENLTLQRSSTPPNRGCQNIHLQMPERIGVEIFVCEHLVSETADMVIRTEGANVNGAKFLR
jgi:hypothetical protein